MSKEYKSSNGLDNGLLRCSMPQRSESGRGRSKAVSVVSMRNPCRVGTWNVRTMLVEGKLEELKQEMTRLNIDILGLSEVRWEGSGDFWDDNFRIIYTGDKKGSNGTAIILNKKWGNQIGNTIHSSDRLTAIKLNTQNCDTFIVQVYMPTGSHTDEEVDDIYEQIDSIIDTVKDKDNLIIMGDFNAVVGEEIDNEIMGKYGLGKRNKRGDKLIQFCKEHNLTVLNTKFKLPKRRLYTWKMPGDIGRYQLDYILIKNKYLQNATSCKTYPGADLNTDHNLLMSKLNLEIRKNNIRKTKPKKIDLNKLKAKPSKSHVQYSNTLGDKLYKFKETEEYVLHKENSEVRWNKLRDIIRTSAEECLGREKIVPRKKWLNQDIIELMLERRKFRNKHDNISINKYKKLTNRITTKCRERKQTEMEEKCEKIEHHIKKGQIDKAYRIIKEMDSRKRPRSTVIQDENGKLLIDNRDISHRWKSYIEGLYHGDGLSTEDIEKEGDVHDDDIGPEILRTEFDSALSKLQIGKAAGIDNINIELIKDANDTILDELFEITALIYRTGKIPTDYCTSKLVTLPKKPNTLKCEEHRTLSLITHASKILLKIIQNRIVNKAENIIGPDQYGFRKNKGTREAILALRLLIDRRLDLGLNTFIAFIDLEKAFDKVNWKDMMKTLQFAGIDFRDRRVIYEIYNRQETIIEIGEEKVKAKIKQGVRQGCTLSPILFNIFIEQAIAKISDLPQGGVKINGERMLFIRFADDIAAVAENETELEALLNNMDTIFKEFHLKINVSKTNTLITSKTTPITKTIKMNMNSITQVNSFKYLGSHITFDSRCTTDIKCRIAMAKQTFYSKKHLFKSKIHLNLRKRFIKTYIWSIGLYGCETWILTEKDRKRLEAFEMWCWRRMEGISWTDKVTNEEVLDRVKEKRRLIEHIENRRGKMVGHLIRHDSLIQNIIEGKIEGKRGRGRPRKNYITQLKEKVKVVTYKEVKEMALNREQWKMLHRQEQSS